MVIPDCTASDIAMMRLGDLIVLLIVILAPTLVYGCVLLTFFSLYRCAGTNKAISFAGALFFTVVPLYGAFFVVRVLDRTPLVWDLATLYAAPLFPLIFVANLFLYGK